MKEKIGQLFITGFEGTEPSEDFVENFAEKNLGGLILFEEQCNPHSLAENTIKLLTETAEAMPFIGVDQEGGRVCRLRGAPVEMPSAEEFGEKRGLDSYRDSLSRSAYYLHSLGFNLLFGPVADLKINAANGALQGRTFGSSPAKVMSFVEMAVKISQNTGLLTCAKHFPGLGAASEDPHHHLAVSDIDMQMFLNRESLPFKAAIDAGTDMIMTTHMSVPSFDNRPVTESEVVVGAILREKLDYDGVIITDDLLMKGAAYLGNFGERAFKAFKAGHDILLFGRESKATFEAIEYFEDAYDRGEISDERIENSLDRINGLKSKLMTMSVL